jgi:hypothetical protein
VKYFQQVASGMNVLPLAVQVHNHPELWNRNPARLVPFGPHRETDDIWLRYKDEAPHKATGDYSHFADEHYPIWYPAYFALPASRLLIFSVMTRFQGESLGGVLIYRIPPGKRIYAHIDSGWHVDYHEKFNIYLQADERTAFRYGNGEAIRAQTGDIYHFTNSVMHEVVNEGDLDHLVMTVCIHTSLEVAKCHSPGRD